MNYIKGKVRNIIYESDSLYKVGLFRVKETTDEEMEDFLNKTITFTGYFAELNMEDTYILYGNYVYHERYGHQYQVTSYERVEPQGKDAVIEFLSSNLVSGCGEKTAIRIVEVLGDDALNKIKEDANILTNVVGLKPTTASKIYHSILKYRNTEDMIVALKEMGFSLKEALDIVKKYEDTSLEQVQKNIYVLKELIDFDKLDKIYLTFGISDSKVRSLACILEAMNLLGTTNGDTYFMKEEIYTYLSSKFGLFLEEDAFLEYLEELLENRDIIQESNHYFLKEVYEMERGIANNLYKISTLPTDAFAKLDLRVTQLESMLQVTYNEEQKMAIKKALQNSITVITGGPGTGKTTIINAIVKLFIEHHHYTPTDIIENIALLAPTGRASKKMSESTTLPAMTIHRFLKWQKDHNSFAVNELHKEHKKLVIVDEMSMIDTYLFDSLLKGLDHNMQLILVGDTNQLPSVGAGQVLADLISSDCLTHVALKEIYRQSNNSYIPLLAKEIKEHDVKEEFKEKKDDYNFLSCDAKNIKAMVEMICKRSLEKGLDENEIQILAPMYKGENGIDQFNILLQDLFNPANDTKKETKYGDFTYREGDKVLQLVNDPDNNVFNGDIGYIREIGMQKVGSRKKEIITIDFDGIYVEYGKEDLSNIRHAYAITIHKSQGSEFPHVILPITKNYYKMLYNKLIYTGVSRAKKSLVIIGEEHAFLMSVANDYSKNRKTSLKEKIIHNFIKVGES